MPGKTKSSKIIRSKNTETRKKRGGFLGMGTWAVNITTEGVILNENYKNNNGTEFQHELLGLELKFKGRDKLESFYKRSDESYSRMARSKLFGRRMNTTSVIDNKIIDMLANEDILCTSKVRDTHILFKFDKLPENKKITLSRMFKSNWYSVEIIWNSGEFKGFTERSPKMLSTLRNLIPFSGNPIESRTNIVNKYDTDFWFNFKPYFDLNDFGDHKTTVVDKLTEKSREHSYNGLNFMHKLHFSPTIVEYEKEDESKLI